MRWFLPLALLLACRVVHAEDYQPTYEQYKALCAKGRYQEALPLAEQALRLSEKEFGEAHENTAVLLANLGLIYERLGDYEKAAQLLRRSVDIELRLYGKDSPKVARAFEDLGRVYESLGEYGIAEIAFSRALQIYRSKFGADDPKAKSVASLLARVISRSRPQGRGSLSEAEPPKARGQTKPTRPSPVDPTPVGTNLTAQTSNADEPQLYRRSVPLAWVLLWLGVICLAFWFPGTLRSLASRVSAAFKRLAQLVNAAMKKRASAIAERQERLKREREAERQRRQEELVRARAKEAHEEMQRQARELAELKRWANAERQQRVQREAERQRKQEELEHARAKEAHEEMQRQARELAEPKRAREAKSQLQESASPPEVTHASVPTRQELPITGGYSEDPILAFIKFCGLWILIFGGLAYLSALLIPHNPNSAIPHDADYNHIGIGIGHPRDR